MKTKRSTKKPITIDEFCGVAPGSFRASLERDALRAEDEERHRSIRLQVSRLKADLDWCYDRLSHLLFICDHPESVQAGFGPGETMAALRENLPGIRAKHGLRDIYAK